MEKNKKRHLRTLIKYEVKIPRAYDIEMEKRVLCHNTGKGAKYTKPRFPVEVVYYEVFAEKEAAMHREYEIK